MENLNLKSVKGVVTSTNFYIGIGITALVMGTVGYGISTWINSKKNELSDKLKGTKLPVLTTPADVSTVVEAEKKSSFKGSGMMTGQRTHGNTFVKQQPKGD